MIRRGVKRFFHLALRRRDRWEREVEDEIKLHLALRAEQLAAEGRSLDDAYEEAIRRFGPLTESRARLVDAARHREVRMQRTEYWNDLTQDLRFALRTLRRQKAWTAVIILTLALGIGATTAVFSVVSTLLLHPLPFPHADRIVYISEQPTHGNNTGMSVSITPTAKDIRAWTANARSFELIGGRQTGPKPMRTTGDEPRMVMVEKQTPNFIDFVGVKPIVGHMFTQEDIDRGMPVVVLSEGFWRQSLAARTGVIGQRITLADTAYTIVGVLPAAALAPSSSAPIEMWIPANLRDDKAGFSTWARLRPGVAKEAATAELNAILSRTYGLPVEKVPFTATLARPGEKVRFRDSLLLLAYAVGLVLLVACANVAHLLLARSSTRQREMAIRAALGAGRGRLVRQLLTESALLSATGAVTGVLVGWAGLRAMIALRPSSLSALSLAHLDGSTLLLVTAVALGCAVLFVLLGAAQSARASTHDALKRTPSGGVGARGRGRGLLVVSEMALSALLLVGASLLVRSVINLQRSDLGFDTANLYAANVPVGAKDVGSEETGAAVVDEIASRLRANPAVQGVTVASVAPGSRWFSVGRFEIDGEPLPGKTETSFTDVNAVATNYFSVMGVRFVQGRTFSDTSAAAHQVIVNESFARKHWPQSALGRRIRIASSDSASWLTIVGVVADVQTSGPLSESTAPMLFTPRWSAESFPAILARTSGGATVLASAATETLKQYGHKQPITAESVAANMATSIATPKFAMLLLTIFTTLALVLAAVGLYGVMSYSVAERTREIGIRVALGASDAAIARRVIGGGTSLAAVGAAIGLGAAVWGTKLIEAQLYGLTRLDPASYVVGGIVLLAAALVASIVPTRRALAVDPMTAIRAE